MKDLFHEDAETDTAFYTIDLFIEGQRTPVVIDHYIPVYEDSEQPAFSRSKDHGELWIMLLEKAYSKMHGTYEKTVGGSGYEALIALSGAPTQRFNHKDYPGSLFDVVEPYARVNMAMTAGSNIHPGGEVKMDNGIVYGHEYTLLDVLEVDDNGSTKRLYKIRNPWGKYEWNGDWSDSSSKWTRNLKSQVGHEVADDGVFYMEEDDYLQEFEIITVCFADKSFKDNSERVSHPKGGFSLLEIDVDSTMDTLYFVASQATDELNGRGKTYDLSNVRLVVGRKTGDTSNPYEFIGAARNYSSE